MHTGFWWGNLRDGGHLEDQDVYGRLILKRILKNRVGAWTESGRGSGQVAGSGEYGTEPLCFIKCGEFLY